MVIVIGGYNHKIFNKNIYRLILLNVCQALRTKYSGFRSWIWSNSVSELYNK